MTMKQRVERYLGETDCVLCHGGSALHQLYMLSDGTRYYWVGRHGGIRVSTRPTMQGSVSVTESVHRKMVVWEREQGYNKAVADGV